MNRKINCPNVIFFSLSGVPLPSSDAEGRAVCTPLCVDYNIIPSAGTPSKFGAVSFAGTLADVPNSQSLCNIIIDIPKEQKAILFDVRARRSHVNQPPGVPCGPLNVFCESVRLWNINSRKFLTRNAEILFRLCNSKVDIVCLPFT